MKKSPTKGLYYLLHEELFKAKTTIYWFISSPPKSDSVKLKPVEPTLTQITFVIQHRELSPADFVFY